MYRDTVRAYLRYAYVSYNNVRYDRHCKRVSSGLCDLTPSLRALPRLEKYIKLIAVSVTVYGSRPGTLYARL